MAGVGACGRDARCIPCGWSGPGALFTSCVCDPLSSNFCRRATTNSRISRSLSESCGEIPGSVKESCVCSKSPVTVSRSSLSMEVAAAESTASCSRSRRESAARTSRTSLPHPEIAKLISRGIASPACFSNESELGSLDSTRDSSITTIANSRLRNAASASLRLPAFSTGIPNCFESTAAQFSAPVIPVTIRMPLCTVVSLLFFFPLPLLSEPYSRFAESVLFQLPVKGRLADA